MYNGRPFQGKRYDDGRSVFLPFFSQHTRLNSDTRTKSARHRVVSRRKEKAMKKDTGLGLLGMIIMFPIGLMIAVAPLWM